jgi:nucleoid DNA-binding protein
MAEICEVIHEAHPEISAIAIRTVFTEIFDTVSEAVALGKPVTIVRFGTFSPKTTKPRVARDVTQQNRSTVTIPPKAHVIFKVAGPLSERLNKRD